MFIEKNGCMRLLYSHKPNDARKKKPETHQKDIMKHLFQSTPFSNSGKKELPSPPSSPPQSPKVKVEEEEETMEFEPIIEEKKCDLNEIKNILDYCRNDECYEYQQWIEIGMAIHNLTNGDDIGLSIYKDFSKDYVGFKNKTTKRVIDDKWKSFNSDEGNKLGMTSLRKLKEKYKPKETIIETSLESIFCYTWETNYQKRLQFWEENKQEDEEAPDRGMFIKGAIKSVLEK